MTSNYSIKQNKLFFLFFEKSTIKHKIQIVRSAAMNSEEKLSRLLFSFSNLSGWVLCGPCVFAPLNSQGGHVNKFAPAGRVKPGSRCGILALMSAVMLGCLSISLAAIKSVVVGDQVNQGCSALKRQFGFAVRSSRPHQLKIRG